MSLWAEIWAYKQPVKSSGERFVLVAHAHFSDRNGDGWPGQRSIAAMTMLSPRSVRRHERSLERQGRISRRARYRSDGSRTSDLTHLNAPFECLGPPDEHPEPAENLTDGPDKLSVGRGQKKVGATDAGDHAMGSVCPGSDHPGNDHGSAKEGASASKRPRSRTATELPDGFEPDEKSLALLRKLGLDLNDELENFVSYHRQGQRFTDWQARFQTFIRKSPGFNKTNGRDAKADDETAAEAFAARGCTHGNCRGLSRCKGVSEAS